MKTCDNFSQLEQLWALLEQVLCKYLQGYFSKMLGARARLTADPMIGVADLVDPLKNYLESEKDDNAMKLLQPPATASWKSGCPTSWLASLSELWKSYVKLAPNTLIPSKKHRTALGRLCATKKINYSSKKDDDFVEKLDDYVRMGLSHLRQLKQDPKKKEQAFRKCDKDQQRALEDVLALVNVEVNVEAESQLLPFHAQGDSQGSNEVPLSPKRLQVEIADKGTRRKSTSENEAIFDNVLKGDSEGEGDDEIPITIFKKSKAKAGEDAAPSTQSDSPQRGNMFSLAMNKTEKALLKSALGADPIARDGKSQNQRLNQNAPKKAKAKGKGGKKAAAKASAAKAGSKRSQTSKGKNAKEPKQTIPEEKETLPEDEEELINMIPEGTLEMAMEKAKEWDKEGVARGVRRTRTTSKAYHACEVQLQKQGMTKGEAQAVGRVAGRLVGKMFDKDWPLAKGKGKAKAKVMSGKPATSPSTAKDNVKKQKKESRDQEEDERKEPEDVD